MDAARQVALNWAFLMDVMDMDFDELYEKYQGSGITKESVTMRLAEREEVTSGKMLFLRFIKERGRAITRRTSLGANFYCRKGCIFRNSISRRTFERRSEGNEHLCREFVLDRFNRSYMRLSEAYNFRKQEEKMVDPVHSSMRRVFGRKP